MRQRKDPPFDLKDFFAPASFKKLTINYEKNRRIFSQGDSASTVFYVRQGTVKLTVISKHGKEAVIGILGVGDFVGEGCMLGHTLRTATASTITPCVLVRVEKQELTALLHSDRIFSDRFISHLIARKSRIEADLVDQLFNSSEKRLARALLLLAQHGKEGRPEPVVHKISQETLAKMIGSTRSRVSVFMNKFRKMGFIHYNGGLQVHNSLLNVVLRD
jgi:CRP/FNR family transcriptional regulator, cyclic AMP receptor protein